MSFQRNSANSGKVPTLFRLTNSEIELDGSGGLRQKYNKLNEDYAKLQQENIALRENQSQLEAQVIHVKSKFKNTQEVNSANLEKIALENDELEKCKIELKHEQEKAKMLEAQLKLLRNKNEEQENMLNVAENKIKNTKQTTVLLEEEMLRLTILVKDRNKIEDDLLSLSEKVAHFAKEASEKRKNVPNIGQNNIEDIEVQKFIDFVTNNTKILGDLVPNGLNSSLQPTDVSLVYEYCKICNKHNQFAKCVTEDCGGTYHEHCIKRWFMTKRECPCCHEDSIEFEEDLNDY